MKNRIFAVLALSAAASIAACERPQEGQVTPATEAPAASPAPGAEPVPMTTDTMMMHGDTLHTDTMHHGATPGTLPADTL